MNTIQLLFRCCLLLGVGLLAANGGSFTSGFNDGALPPGTHTNSNANGGAYLELTGGVGNSGCLKLTKNIGSQMGSFIIDDLDGGQPVYGFDIACKLRIGGGSGNAADGMSICFGPDLTDTSLFGEDGVGSGIRFVWDIYSNPDTPPAPKIAVRVGSGGTFVATKPYAKADILTSGSDPSEWFADVHIRLDPDGSLDFEYKGQTVFTNLFIAGYQEFVDALSPGRFGFGARTGGENANQWVDDLQITTFTQPIVGISQQPFSQVVQQGDDVTFDVRVGNVNGVTYQWFKNNAPISEATSQTLRVSNVQPGDSGSLYKVTATGPNNAVTSTEVTLTVTNLALPAPPQLAFDFNDGATPPEALLVGDAIVDLSGGVANSGCLKLVNPAGSGAMLIANPAEAGQPVYGFTARFKAHLGGGTVPPADGFAFAFGTDIPDTPSGEFENGAGLGSGLRVSFDIYNNDTIFGYNPNEAQPAPSIDVRYGNQVLATAQFPISFMETGVNPEDSTPIYEDTIIQLNTDGTLNVVYHGAVVFDHLTIPGFSFVSGGRFAIAARTGGLNENIWIDDFELTSATNASGAFRITSQPTGQMVLVNRPITFSVGVNDTNGVTYQWLRNGATIAGANGSSYTFSPPLSDNGVNFSVQATKGGTTLTSSNALLTVVDLAAPTNPNLTFNFNDGQVPPNTALYAATAGGGYITLDGGVGNSGVLHITDNVNSQAGAFVISNLYSGAQVSAIAASWDVRLGGGSGNAADGYSFNFAPNLPAAAGGGENGYGNGISVCFDIYGTLADSPPAPNVNIRYKGSLVASTQVPKEQLETGADFRTVLLRVDADGKLYLAYGDRVFYNGLQLPNYTFTSAGQFGFYGRTGGENENQWIDNIMIKATQSSGPLSVIDQPDDVTVISGRTATFTVGLSDPNNATYQWYKNDAVIAGGNASAYTTPATSAADNGAVFKVQATGPGGAVTSSNAVLTVVDPITISSPLVVYDFNDGALPENTILNSGNGGGYITFDGGVTNSGVLHLTDPAEGQVGTLIIPDLNNNEPVSAITVYFAIRVGGGSTPPADGFSFNWCSSNDVPSGITFGEDGLGNNLIVKFDIYDNGNETPPAPSIDVVYKNNLIATKQLPYAQLETGDEFGDVFIRVSSNGILDMQYNGMAIFNQVALPGYTALAGGVFAFGARTGGLNENQWIDNIAIATSTGVLAPTLGFAVNGSNLVLSWDAGFKLQSTPSLSIPNWQDVPNATSPQTVPTGAGSQYYRLANQ